VALRYQRDAIGLEQRTRLLRRQPNVLGARQRRRDDGLGGLDVEIAEFWDRAGRLPQPVRTAGREPERGAADSG